MGDDLYMDAHLLWPEEQDKDLPPMFPEKARNLYRVRKAFGGKCILQCYHKAANPENSGWFDVPYHKAPPSLCERMKYDRGA